MKFKFVIFFLERKLFVNAVTFMKICFILGNWCYKTFTCFENALIELSHVSCSCQSPWYSACLHDYKHTWPAYTHNGLSCSNVCLCVIMSNQPMNKWKPLYMYMVKWKQQNYMSMKVFTVTLSPIQCYNNICYIVLKPILDPSCKIRYIFQSLR